MRKQILTTILSCILFASAIFTPHYASAEDVHTMTAEELEAYIAYLQVVLQTKQKREGITDTPPVEHQTAAPVGESIDITFNGKVYTGTYQGEMQDGKPYGNGTFEGFHQGNKLRYTGQWLDGAMNGNGYVEADAYTLHFDNAEGIYDRTGSYIGDLVNGLPEGNGTFKAVDSQNVLWQYTGEWQKGMFNGQGVQSGTGNYIAKAGTFTNNEYTPTAADAFIYLSQQKNYNVSATSKAALNKYTSCFSEKQKSGNPPEDFIDSSFDIKQYKKNPRDYGDKLIYIFNAEVFQVLTWEIGDKTVEQVLMRTEDDTVYFGFYYGKSNIVEDMKISGYVLPFDWTTYKNVSNTDVWAVFCAITDYVDDTDARIKQVKSKLTKATVGSTITYGNFKWKVLAIETNKMLVIAEDIVCSRAYHSQEMHVTWAECDLRAWLNGEFYQSNFSPEERSLIHEVENNNSGKDPFGTVVKNGKATKDRIFVFKYEEAKKYSKIVVNGTSDWWTRTPDNWGSNYYCGSEWSSGETPATDVTNRSMGVRPVMWINLGTNR